MTQETISKPAPEASTNQPEAYPEGQSPREQAHKLWQELSKIRRQMDVVSGILERIDDDSEPLPGSAAMAAWSILHLAEEDLAASETRAKNVAGLIPRAMTITTTTANTAQKNPPPEGLYNIKSDLKRLATYVSAATSITAQAEEDHCPLNLDAVFALGGIARAAQDMVDALLVQAGTEIRMAETGAEPAGQIVDRPLE